MKTPTALHYEITGSGPTVVLLHGYMASSKYWARVSEQLSHNHRVIALDLLGFGKSPKPSCSRYDYEAQLRSIDATLDQLGVRGQFTLVGHSMGSLVALRYARERSHRIKRLLLTNMPIWQDPEQAKGDVLGAHPIYRYILQPGLHSFFWIAFRIAIRFSLLPEQLTTDLRKRRDYLFQSSSTSRLRSLRNVIYAAKVEADLTALTVKTVILSGIRDNKNYLLNLDPMQLGSHILRHRVDEGHHLPLQRPELVAQFIG